MKRTRLWAVRVAVVCAAVTGTTAVAATSASAVVKNPTTLCKDHGGVDVVGKGFVVCMDGEVFDI